MAYINFIKNYNIKESILVNNNFGLFIENNRAITENEKYKIFVKN